MDDQKLKWYETHVKEFLDTTLYDPNSLTVELPEEKWLEINPTRGIRQGIESYDLTRCKHSFLSRILRDSYGEYEFDRNVIDNRIFRINRRTLAAGGGLYPNIIYIVMTYANEVRTYQYNPTLNTMNYLGSTEENLNDLDKNCCYFVITNYYWRNFLKYRYFGYRLMLVDTGYALANLCLALSKNRLEYRINISSKLFKALDKSLNVNLKYESICCAVSVKNKILCESLKDISDSKISYKLFDDWDTSPTNLYKILETNVNNEDFNLCETINKSINEFKLPYNLKYRVSPGGGPMISIKPIGNIKFEKTLKNFANLKNIFGKFSEDIETYVYVNKVENVSTGLYIVDNEGSIIRQECNYTSKDYQQMLRKKNFNLYETPAFFFFGTNLKRMIKKYGTSGFKIAQIKIGLASQLLTYAGCLNECWTHAILGFEVDMAEKFTNVKDDLNLLNLVAFSDSKPLDRFSANF